MDRQTTQLAGEFLVAGELSRRGFPVSITKGNAKFVDIIASTAKGKIRIDARAKRSKGNWQISRESLNKDVFYVFVYLKTANQIEKNMSPEYFVVPGRDLVEKNLITDWGEKQGVKYLDLDNATYRNRWDKITEHQ